MLVELKIENFGILERVRVRLGPGLNVLTGETGSGKSLILQGLEALLGARMGQGVVRNGAHRAHLEAVLDLHDREGLRAQLAERGFGSEDFLTLSREINSDGRSRCTVNGEPARLSDLRSLSVDLMELHGQHEHQRIVDPDVHLDGLDLFAGAQDLRRRTADLYGRYSGLRRRLRTAHLEAGERDRRLDFLRFALDEIESFEPREGEFEELEHEKALIQNSGRMFTDVNEVYDLIREGETPVLDALYRAETLLESHAGLQPELDRQCAELQEARYRIEALADFLRDQKDALQFSPERLEDIDERLTGYRRLFKKHGGNTASVLRVQADFLKELSLIEMSDEEAELLRSELAAVEGELRDVAEELSRVRRAAVPRLEAQLKSELAELGMPGAEITVSVRRELDPDAPSQGERAGGGAGASDRRTRYAFTDRGLDRVEFLLRANAGEDSKPLRKAASGGEMSRITLALKSVLMEHRPVGTIVFDEIDSGVGGEVAHSIAARLRGHAARSQVIVVTHLHQVAGQADHHFYISKHLMEGRTVASVQRLNGERRLHELARMLGGNRPGTVVLEHARQLLNRAAG